MKSIDIFAYMASSNNGSNICYLKTLQLPKVCTIIRWKIQTTIEIHSTISNYCYYCTHHTKVRAPSKHNSSEQLYINIYIYIYIYIIIIIIYFGNFHFFHAKLRLAPYQVPTQKHISLNILDIAQSGCRPSHVILHTLSLSLPALPTHFTTAPHIQSSSLSRSRWSQSATPHPVSHTVDTQRASQILTALSILQGHSTCTSISPSYILYI